MDWTEAIADLADKVMKSTKNRGGFDQEHFGRGIHHLRLSAHMYRDDFSVPPEVVRRAEHGDATPAELEVIFSDLLDKYREDSSTG